MAVVVGGVLALGLCHVLLPHTTCDIGSCVQAPAVLHQGLVATSTLASRQRQTSSNSSLAQTTRSRRSEADPACAA